MGEELTPKRLWVAVLVAVIGGNTTGLLNAITPEVRKDPLTGSEGRELLLEIHRIDKIQYLMGSRMERREKESEAITNLLRQHMRGHP